MKADLIGQFHDEHIFRINDTEEDEQKARKIIREAIDKLNKEIKLNRDLDVGIQVGYKYSDIH